MKKLNAILDEYKKNYDQEPNVYNNYLLRYANKLMDTADSIASMKKIVKSDYGVYKLITLMQEDSYNEQIKFDVAKKYEFALYALVKNAETSQISSVFKKEMGMDDRDAENLIYNVIRVARAEGLEYKNKGEIEKDMPSEVKIYKDRVKAMEYIDSMGDGSLQSGLLFDFYGNIKEALKFEESYQKNKASEDENQ